MRLLKNKFTIAKRQALLIYYLLSRSDKLCLFTIVLIGGFLRFYKLDWGEGFFFHPDEYHTAISVDQLSFPAQMNPHFFSYGSFTIYLIFFTKLLLQTFNSQFSTLNPILIGRFYSAFFSTLTIIIIFLIASKLFKNNKPFSLLTAFLTATTPGLVQQAHFATPESTLIFWLFLTLYLWIKWLEEKKTKSLYLSAAFLGLGLATKIPALTFLPILIFLPLANLFFKSPNTSFQILKASKKLVYLIKLTGLSLVIVILAFIFISPYSLIDWQNFRYLLNYEIGLTQGKQIVFYTRQFIKTTPVLFQFQKIFPFALGPTILAFGILGFLAILTKVILTIFRKKFSNPQLLILLFAFLFYFLPNAFLFVKWTRFMAPTFPFFSLFTGYFVYLTIKSFNRLFLRYLIFLLLTVNLIWAWMFFSLYLHPDVRVATTAWSRENLPSGSFILTETGNMLEVPLKGNFQKVPFDFYYLDEKQKLQKELPELLTQADYFIIQSRRIFTNHQRLSEQFPKTSKFYSLLSSGQLGFEKIKTVTSFPKLEISRWCLELPDELAEETWSVFDHPVIRIYKKVVNYQRANYEKLLEAN